jgi:hypothetical protein
MGASKSGRPDLRHRKEHFVLHDVGRPAEVGMYSKKTLHSRNTLDQCRLFEVAD